METIKKLLEEQEKLQKQIDSLGIVNATDYSHLAAFTLADELRRQEQDLIRNCFGGIDKSAYDAAQLAISDSNKLASLIPYQSAIETAQFYLPEQSSIHELIKTVYGAGVIGDVMAHYHSHTSSFEAALEHLNSPWLNMRDPLESLTGMASLYGIGTALGTYDSFGDTLSDLLRGDLGDWRNEISWQQSIFDDSASRHNFYREQGFNSSLTAFPSKTFEETLTVTGIVQDSEQEGPLDRKDKDEEKSLKRTNKAHSKIFTLETELREFIAVNLHRTFGPNWIKSQIPEPMRKQWQERQEKAVSQGQESKPLISYADFTDYQQIIARKDNWSRVFFQYFNRQEYVTESLQRLYPIRNCVMHSRHITKDDFLYLHVESKRIFTVIKQPTNSR